MRGVGVGWGAGCGRCGRKENLTCADNLVKLAVNTDVEELGTRFEFKLKRLAQRPRLYLVHEHLTWTIVGLSMALWGGMDGRGRPGKDDLVHLGGVG